MSDEPRLSPTNLLAAAERELVGAGYRRVPEQALARWPADNVRVYEDPYCVATIAVYETWSELSTGWLHLQESLVELMSKFWTRSDAKAWDGYIVLLTPGTPGSSTEAEAIRYNTTRVRKLLATGEDLRRLSDVTRVLAPLLPVDQVAAPSEETALEMLPRLLAQHGIDEQAVRVLVQAFERNEPLVETLHSRRTST